MITSRLLFCKLKRPGEKLTWIRRLSGCIILPALYCDNRALSVCYGALNLLVRVDASNFVPYACDRAVTGGECEGPEVLYHRPLFPVVAYFRDSHTCISRPWASLKAGALCLLYVLYFYNRPDSLISTPLVSFQVSCFVPQ